jgi:CP family cyanate transporter-like MFS transporter
LLLGLFLAALNLRSGLASVPPLLETIRQDLGLGRAEAGLLTTIPVLCMSVFALTATRIREWIGAERGMLWALVLIGGATAGRSLGGAALALFSATLLMGIGIAVAQTLIPAIVKETFSDRAAAVTGLYSVGINTGAALAAGATVPLEDLLGGSWPKALAAWSLLAAIAAVVWWPLARKGHRDRKSSASPNADTRTPMPWRSRRAWLVCLFFGSMSCIFYSSLTWLAPLYRDQGFGEERAGLLLTLFTLVQIVAALGIPPLADRSEDRRPWLAISLVATAAGLIGVALAPLLTPWAPWAWTTLLGLGIGVLFPLSLTLPLDNTDGTAAAGRLTAMMFFVGYLISALGPYVVGGLRDLSGDFGVPFLALAALSIGMFIASLRLQPRRRT